MSQVYVSTYRKYNHGSLQGDWLSLSDHSSKAEFLEACRELHDDEPDPELMFQDWESIPDRYITESEIDEGLWDWLQLAPDEQAIVEVYASEIDTHADLETAIDRYCGKYDSEENWAVNFWDETGMLDQVPEFAQSYIDFEKYANDARMGGDIYFVSWKGEIWAFRSH